MTSEQMEQFKNEIHEELRNAVNNSKLGEVFQKYGITGNKTYQFECILDLTKIPFQDGISNQLVKSEERVRVDCCGCEPPFFCCSC
ncbi:hypothetical protein DP116_08705 [Brasilonema bromeliae SPC951]|uniref:Nif11-type n=1 Tax=Brasilonema bromeliae SPC951 TaxID=385972 RepID=A0ABX1P6U8_9CYAN|nr:hypothetical protein [Brasilonema bromeliae SPC951]